MEKDSGKALTELAVDSGIYNSDLIIQESFEDLENVNVESHTIFKPQASKEKASKQFKRWEKAVQISKG
ncbi:hypothetical protein NEMBOFW57_001251 [Staphylotrichum longicolle]|uniref:Uncharacterized protein n=1 Tax=Staphylotrichum longicolle TaxID=669026 RepID=A0AAD4F176_9PEZI|nr:hypothetical protein NEMBOFW57_001251 [Staphylotrichum longicolle]